MSLLGAALDVTADSIKVSDSAPTGSSSALETALKADPVLLEPLGETPSVDTVFATLDDVLQEDEPVSESDELLALDAAFALVS